ncbi:MAG TPA: phosphoglycerate kinase [Kofleriaceae bacterium]|jgi:phosphoglycerate kinase|nr:phosphoglycerate kinase [Kofleriaceae bacterium]
MALPNGIKSVEQLNVEGKRVFVRVDYNVPLDKKTKKISDDARIVATLPTVKHLVDRGARIVLGSHLGRPEGQVKPEFSLEPVAAHLAELLKTDVALADEPVGDGARKVVSDLRDGQIAMLENLRFNPGEEANDETFARTLASYADVYVNDAFGTAHRAHASTAGMVKFVAEKGAGFVMAKEIEFLSRLLGDVDRPYVAVLGGAKVSDKIEVLDALLERVNSIVIGGAMANTFLEAQGKNVGKSKVEKDKLPVARNFLRKASEKKITIHLPTDVATGVSIEDETPMVVRVDQIGSDQMALDIGPGSVELFRRVLNEARTVFWNGPMGVFEKTQWSKGTVAVAKALADNKMALTVVGGGDSAAAIAQAGLADKVSHVSTGGGASLEFVQGLDLPGIAALRP